MSLNCIPLPNTATGGAVGGASNLVTTGAVPYVSAAGVLSQGNFSISSPATVTPTLTLGSSTQAFELRSRGTDSGVSQGVPFFRSATANTPTAFDVMPNGNPASTLSGTAWLDVCSTDLSPSNSDTWNCGAIQVSGYIWYINNGSLVSVSVLSNVATATTLAAHNVTTGQAITVQGGPTNLAGTYTLTGGSGTTFTFTTVGVADGTYSTAGMVISTAGSIQIGLHNSSAGLAQSSLTLTGASIGFQSRSGPGANTTYANLTASSFALGSSIAWFYNTKTQRMASDFVVRWSSTTDPNGTADTSLSRVSAGIVGVGTGGGGSTAGTLQAATLQALGNGSASNAMLLGSGTWFTGGSATTTKPYLLVEPSGTTSTGWSTSGTGIGVNAASGFAGRLLDLQVAGSSKVNITSTGAASFAGTLDATNVIVTGAGALYWGANQTVLRAGTTNGNLQISNFAGNDFGVLQFGGTTSSFPALKRSTTGLIARLADDSADTWIKVKSVITSALTVATLPASPTAGERAFVTDSNAVSFTAGIGAVVAAGGTTAVPVVYDGTNWRIG